MEDCIFCKIAAKRIPARIIYEDDLCIAFEDIAPQAPVHIVIIPREHIPTTMDVKTEENYALIAKVFEIANKIAEEKGLDKSGFRLVNNYLSDGGQAVYHLHFHLFGGRKMGWPPG